MNAFIAAVLLVASSTTFVSGGGLEHFSHGGSTGGFSGGSVGGFSGGSTGGFALGGASAAVDTSVVRQVGVARLARVNYVREPVVNVQYVRQPVVSYVTRPVKSVSYVSRPVVSYRAYPLLAQVPSPVAVTTSAVVGPSAGGVAPLSGLGVAGGHGFGHDAWKKA